MPPYTSSRLASRLILAAAVLLMGVSAWAIVTDLTNVANVHRAAAHHVTQAELESLPAAPVNQRFPAMKRVPES